MSRIRCGLETGGGGRQHWKVGRLAPVGRIFRAPKHGGLDEPLGHQITEQDLLVQRLPVQARRVQPLGPRLATAHPTD